MMRKTRMAARCGVAAVASNRVGYREGVPVYAMENGEVRALDGRAGPPRPEVKLTMVRRRVPPGLRG